MFLHPFFFRSVAAAIKICVAVSTPDLPPRVEKEIARREKLQELNAEKLAQQIEARREEAEHWVADGQPDYQAIDEYA